MSAAVAPAGPAPRTMASYLSATPLLDMARHEAVGEEPCRMLMQLPLAVFGPQLQIAPWRQTLRAR